MQTIVYYYYSVYMTCISIAVITNNEHIFQMYCTVFLFVLLPVMWCEHLLLPLLSLELNPVCLLFSRWIATPLAASAGIKQQVHLKAQDVPILELYYTTRCRNPAQVSKVTLR